QHLERTAEQIKTGIPEVSSIDPRTQIDGDYAVLVLHDHNHRSRVFQHLRMFIEQVLQQLDGQVQIIAIAYAHTKVQTTSGVAAVVNYRVAADQAIGQRELNAFHLLKAGQEQTHFLHGPVAFTNDRYRLARTQRTQHQQHDASRDILQCVLQGQTNGQAGSTQYRNNAGGLYAKTRQYSDQHKYANRPDRHGLGHGYNRRIHSGGTGRHPLDGTTSDGR